MTHRRDFVRTLALGAAASAAGPALGDEPKTKDEPKRDRGPTPPKSEAEGRMELIVARFGKHLDDPARKAVRAEVEAIVRRAEALRKFPLDNGDGPFPVFTPYRRPPAEDAAARPGDADGAN